MERIRVENVDIDIPVFDANTRSLRAELINGASNKRLLSDGLKLNVVKVLHEINLSISEGDAVGIIGSNGSGKTSLLRLLSQIYSPTRGTLKISGTTRSLLNLGSGIEPTLTGRENIRRLRCLYDPSSVYSEALEREIISFSGLNNFIDLPVRTYSSGMTMRLMFSSMVFDTPDIFILDEFFSTGDEDFTKVATEKMEQLVKSASVFIFSSHSTADVKKYCNRFFLMEQGRATEISACDF